MSKLVPAFVAIGAVVAAGGAVFLWLSPSQSSYDLVFEQRGHDGDISALARSIKVLAGKEDTSAIKPDPETGQYLLAGQPYVVAEFPGNVTISQTIDLQQVDGSVIRIPLDAARLDLEVAAHEDASVQLKVTAPDQQSFSASGYADELSKSYFLTPGSYTIAGSMGFFENSVALEMGAGNIDAITLNMVAVRPMLVAEQPDGSEPPFGEYRFIVRPVLSNGELGEMLKNSVGSSPWFQLGNIPAGTYRIDVDATFEGGQSNWSRTQLQQTVDILDPDEKVVFEMPVERLSVSYDLQSLLSLGADLDSLEVGVAEMDYRLTPLAMAAGQASSAEVFFVRGEWQSLAVIARDKNGYLSIQPLNTGVQRDDVAAVTLVAGIGGEICERLGVSDCARLTAQQ